MTDRDRITPKDPMPAVAPRPARSEQAQREDAQRAMREAGSAARQAARGKAPPPLPERSRTPESGGIEAQPKRIEVEMATIEPDPRSKAPTHSDWAKLKFKLASALLCAQVHVIGAGAFYIVTLLQARGEAQRATKKAETATTSTDKAAERLTAVEAYLTAEAARRECVEKQLRDALSRGTGHVITSLPKGDTEWIEQNAPKPVPRTLWLKPTWFTTEACKELALPPRPPSP